MSTTATNDLLLLFCSYFCLPSKDLGVMKRFKVEAGHAIDEQRVQIVNRWSRIQESICQTYDIEDKKSVDIQVVLYLIGVQELGQPGRKFTKAEKIDLIHIGTCAVLTSYGFYTYKGRDKDQWPHYDQNESLPKLKPSEQELLLKQAIIDYIGEYEAESARE